MARDGCTSENSTSKAMDDCIIAKARFAHLASGCRPDLRLRESITRRRGKVISMYVYGFTAKVQKAPSRTTGTSPISQIEQPHRFSRTCHGGFSTKVSTILWSKFSPGRAFGNAAHEPADFLVARALLVHALRPLVVSSKADTSLFGNQSTMDATAKKLRRRMWRNK